MASHVVPAHHVATHHHVVATHHAGATKTAIGAPHAIHGAHGRLHRVPVVLEQPLAFLRILGLPDFVHLRLHLLHVRLDLAHLLVKLSGVWWCDFWGHSGLVRAFVGSFSGLRQNG